jgi:hypothetical protein
MAGVAVVAVVALARGHGSVIMPPSRNSIDATLPPWSNGNHPETGLIESVNLCILHPLSVSEVPSPTVAKKWGVRVEANPLGRRGQLDARWRLCGSSRVGFSIILVGTISYFREAFG